MSFIVVIPARYASHRLPGKPLADIAGRTMIERVYRRAEKSDASEVIVASDDSRVMTAVEAFGGRAIITSASHPSGTDRLQEVATKLSLRPKDIIVNVQGDEPLMPPSVINQVAHNLATHAEASVATLGEPIEDLATVFDPNAVKVVCDNYGMALYFSRASIPWARDNFGTDSPCLPEPNICRRHIGIYAYRVALLQEFVEWSPAALEVHEKLEQLRILANGHKIHVADAVEKVPGGVDTADDLMRIQEIFLHNPSMCDV